MGLLSWVLFGALAGWVASLLAGTNRRQGCLANVFIGVAGAFIGGFLMELFTGRRMYMVWSLRSFAVAVVGAVILLAITQSRRRR